MTATQPMTFQGSANLEWLAQTAPAAELAVQLHRLLGWINSDTPEVFAELDKEPVRREQVAEMWKWNERLKPSYSRDPTGEAAVRFWVAQTLCTTVMRGRALQSDFEYGQAVNDIMERGADGIFEVGKGQFFALWTFADELTDWLLHSGKKQPLIVESPLGNSLPTQVVMDMALAKGVELSHYIWNSPRNDRAARGATIDNAARRCAEAAHGHDLVLFVDDVTTGTRFLKIFEALIERVGADSFLPVALVVDDILHPQNAKHESRRRLKKRLLRQSKRIGFDGVWRELPPLGLFRLDDGPPARWQNALVWEDSDLVAGKRKVNLFFTLLDHAFDILSDLGDKKSKFRQHLERVWSVDVSGTIFINAPGLVQSTFAKLTSELKPAKIKSAIEALARERFAVDYRGEFGGSADEMGFVKERWDWLRDNYIELASARIGAERARLSWRAVDNVFAATLRDHTPRPGRDQAATPYTIDFNITIRKLNERLRRRIVASG